MKYRVLFLLLLHFTAIFCQWEPLISSSWSMWSPWSFCSNNVMIRVRACSTVRGYKCVGHNKEFQTCNSPPKRKNNLDYEDPEAMDREIAMKQLYQDYEPETPDDVRYAPTTRANRNFHQIGTTTYAPTTVRTTVVDDYQDPTEDPNLGSTFDFEKYPSPTEETTTTTPTTTTTTTTMAPTTTTTEVTTTTTEPTTTTTSTTPEPVPQTVTPYIEPVTIVNSDAMVDAPNIEFRGKYTLEESMTPTPESFPILEDGATHSIGSYAIGKEPEEELAPLVEMTPKLPTFSMTPSSTRNIGEIRRAPTTVTHVELPMEMIPTVTPKIALITAEQNFQHFPKLMNEQRGGIVRPRYIGPTSIPKVTMEITNKPIKKKKKSRRLRKLNRVAKTKLVVLPTDVVPPPVVEMEETKMVVKKKDGDEIPWPTDDRKVYEETKELEARLLALKHRVEMNKMILAKMAPSTTPLAITTTSPIDKQIMVEGDTARALSWMINDMERLVEDKEAEGVKLGEDDGVTTTTESPFPFPVGDGFSLIRSKRSTRKSKVIWGQWTDWTKCTRGKQSRKRNCIKYSNDIFYPIETNSIIEFGEPAPYPTDARQPGAIRQKRSTIKCDHPQIEVRPC